MLLVPLALAHYPHDVSIHVAVSASEVVSATQRAEVWMLARSANDQDVDVRYLAHGQSKLRALALSGARVLAVIDGQLQAIDAEDRVTPLGLGLMRALIADPEGTVALAVGDGLWRSEDGGITWERRLSEGFAKIALSPMFSEDGRAAAISASGEVWTSGDGALDWSLLAPVPADIAGDAELALGPDGRVWLAGGPLYVSDGPAWRPLPTPDALLHVAVLPSGALVATGADAVWRSDDGVGWSRSIEGLDPLAEGFGSPVSGFHYFDLAVRPDGSAGQVYLASWEGLHRSDDAGRSWAPVRVEPATIVRDVVLARDGGSYAYTATYGSGLLAVSLDGAEAWAPGRDLPGQHLRHIALSPDFTRDGVMVTSTGDRAFLSRDRGRTWSELLEALEVLGAVEHLRITDRGWVAGGQAARRASAAWSETGRRWELAEPSPDCERGLAGIVEQGGGFWTACEVDGRVFRSGDGRSWEEVGGVGRPVSGLEGTPDGLLLATPDGLWAWSTAKGASSLAFPGQAVAAITRSGAAIAALLARDGWFLSEDGARWTEMARPTRSLPLSVALSDTFGQDGVVAVGAYDGLWISEDRGRSWAWRTVMEWHDDRSDYWSFPPPWEYTATGCADGLGRARTRSGGTASLEVRGVAVDLELRGGATVRIDGGATEVARGSWESRRLTEGWHRLEVIGDPSARVDGAVVWRQPRVEGGCEGRSAVLGLLGWWGWRRRRCRSGMRTGTDR